MTIEAKASAIGASWALFVAFPTSLLAADTARVGSDYSGRFEYWSRRIFSLASRLVGFAVDI